MSVFMCTRVTSGRLGVVVAANLPKDQTGATMANIGEGSETGNIRIRPAKDLWTCVQRSFAGRIPSSHREDSPKVEGRNSWNSSQASSRAP